MTTKLSDAVQNARLDALETAVGASGTMKIRSGAAPANRAAADSDTVLASLDLPPDRMAGASAG